jgi:anti-sigma factor RsiW
LNCHELQTLLHGYLDGELDLVRNLEIERHLEECSACGERCAAIKKLRQALRKPALYHQPGTQLKERILASLPQRRSVAVIPRRSRRVPALAAVLAVAACFALLALWTWDIVRQSLPAEELLVREVVSGHVRSLMAKDPVDVASADTHTVRPWFQDKGKLGFAPQVRDFTEQGYPLIGARLDFVDNQRVAVLVYKSNKHVINVSTWPQTGGSDEAPRDLSRQGYNLIRWTQAGFTYWAISDLNPVELNEFVRLMRR